MARNSRRSSHIAGVEPLQAPRQVGHQQVDRMVQADVGPFVGQDRRAVLRQVLLGNHERSRPSTERSDALRQAHEDRPVVQPFAAAPADHPHHRAQRPERNAGRWRRLPSRKAPRRGFSRGKAVPAGRAVSEAAPVPSRKPGPQASSGSSRQTVIHAQRQHEREEHRPQHHDAVEAVEGLTAQQQFEKKVENRQAPPPLSGCRSSS